MAIDRMIAVTWQRSSADGQRWGVSAIGREGSAAVFIVVAIFLAGVAFLLVAQGIRLKAIPDQQGYSRRYVALGGGLFALLTALVLLRLAGV